MEKIILSVLVGIGFYFLLSGSDSSKVEKLVNNKVKLWKSDLGPAQMGGDTWSTETIGWIENSRYNKNYNKYPPCFKLSNEAQQVYDMIENKNLVLTHKVLFEAISMILCQYKFLRSKMCADTMIEDRIRDLDALGYVRYDNRYRNKLAILVGTHYNTSSQSSLEFLLRSLTLMEDEINKLNEKLNETEMNQLKNLMSKFYSQFFVPVAKDC
jgi:hypothetical protein